MKTVLIQVPKCASGSVGRLPWVEHAGHVTFEEAVQRFGDKCLYFGIVRHPVDRFVSCMVLVYKHLNSGNMKYYSHFLQTMKHVSFQDFVLLVAECLRDYNGLIINDAYSKEVQPIQLILFRSQSDQLQDIPVVIFFEDLYLGLIQISTKVHAPFMPSDLQHLNPTTIKKPELSNDTIALIEEFYDEDMCRYGYETKVR